MKTIWKFPLIVTDEQQIVLPAGSSALSVGYQDETLMLWALIDTEQPGRWSRVRVIGTGNPADVDGFIYVGTVHDRWGLVWHVWLER